MKLYKITLLSLPLLLGACTESSNEQAATDTEKQSALKEQAKVWTEETKKLGDTAWQSTKEAAGEAADKSKEMYESAKESTAEAYEATKEKTADLYESAKEKSVDAYEATKETTSEAYEATKETTSEAYEATKETTAEELNAAVKAASEKTPTVLEYCEDPIVPSDIIGNPHSSVFDSLSTLVMGGKGRQAKIVSWYDNEWGYSNRVVDLLEKIAL